MIRRTAWSLAVLPAFAPVCALAQGPLGPAFTINDPVNSTDSQYPALASAPDGSFVAVWQYRTPTNFENPALSENREIHGRRYGARGNAFGEEFVVNTVETGQQEQPRVAMNADGDFAVTWQSRVADGPYQIYARRYRADGKPRGKQFRVNQNTEASQRSPKIAINAAGATMVGWVRNDAFPRSNDAMARCYGADGTPLGSDFRVHVGTDGTQGVGGVAATPDGGFLVAYYDWSLDYNYDIRVQRFDAQCQRVGAPIIAAHNPPSESFSKNAPTLATDADGGFVVAWSSQNQDGDREGVYARRYRANGVARGGEFRVNVVTTGPQYVPEIAMDADGDFAIAWIARAEDGNYPGTASIWARRYHAGGDPDGKPFRVHTESTLYRTAPAIALDADGDLVVAWTAAIVQNGKVDSQARRFQAFAEADVSLNQFDSPDPTGASTPLTYTLRVSNLTPASSATGIEAIDRAIGAATNVRVRSKLPPGSTEVTTSGENWSCVVDGDIADCDYRRLLHAAEEAPRLKIRLVPGGTVEPTVSNTARVSADQADPRDTNNRDVETTGFLN